MHINYILRWIGGDGNGWGDGGMRSGGGHAKIRSGRSSRGVGSGSEGSVVRRADDGKFPASAYGDGGGKPEEIPAGQPFAGRMAGGGKRSEIYGTSVYGSGYPGVDDSRGVYGLDFPFYFWPVVFTGTQGAAYLYDSDEVLASKYGQPNNPSRPGGPLAQAQFYSSFTNSTFHLVADRATVTSLIRTLSYSLFFNCLGLFDASNSSSAALPFDSNGTDPRPEQAVKFYRASSVVLTLDGYNNTAALGSDTIAPPSPLPSDVDTVLLSCLNNTIGQRVPLMDAGVRLGANQEGSTFAVVVVLAYLFL
ncbi:hypothetical protein FA95DRAFT_1578473 [Auriscalpium vulgare]|uniref:Uncharacterized protein n=1 Tax=Auriscalpium vulgare TaxID=40419 RepID=A0ACB8R1J3_9AGAM|nr:hypothetical protein FA95DRAFT_1578473 [Auriscalpium vulgare]